MSTDADNQKTTGIFYYQWLFNDWLGSGTRAEMTLEDRAIYRDLLDHQAAKESLPDSAQALANMAMCSPAQIKAFLERWDKLFPRGEDGRRRNAKMAVVRSAALDSRESRSSAGRKGAEARWKRKADGKANGNAIADANGKHAFDSDSDSGVSSSGKGGVGERGSPDDSPDLWCIPSALDTPAFREKWREWLHWRRTEKKSRVTPKSASMTLKKLEPHGADHAARTLDHSIANGYQGVFPDGKGGGATQTAQRRSREFAEPPPDVQSAKL